MPPVASPTESPVVSPVVTPSKSPTKAPTKVPFAAPTKSPIVAQVVPTPTPVVAAPVPKPVVAPFTIISSPVLAHGFQPIRINAGGQSYTDASGQVWVRDQHAIGGSKYSRSYSIIQGTNDDTLYASEQQGNFRYEFELGNASYEVVLHFAETDVASIGQRVFSIQVQGELVFPDFDILSMAEGNMFRAVTVETLAVVSDGTLIIEFVENGKGLPKLNALEILFMEPHLAHAVTNGPYFAVDDDDDGFADVALDGSASHTHGLNWNIASFEWTIDNKVRATTETATVRLPIGHHIATLVVKDTGGNENAESTNIDVVSSRYPTLVSISPSEGRIVGGDEVLIKGTGFDGSSPSLMVHFGDAILKGNQLQLVDNNGDAPTIRLRTPLVAVAMPVTVTIETYVGKSNSVLFTYVDGAPIDFTSGRIGVIPSPTTVAFGPDGKLYVGTSKGHLYKLTLDGRYNILETISSTVVADLEEADEEGNRMILGITFDPMDTSADPPVYVSHSRGFHGAILNSSGVAINGKVSVVSGDKLDTIRHIVTGLPVSDHDHAVNGLEFGDHGELYIQVAGNTNAGVPGHLSTTQLLQDNVLSGATLVANLSDPAFSGTLQYTAENNGDLISGSGVSIFANGLRNPYDLVYHSNGYLYGTDNGPDMNFGDRSATCTTSLPDLGQDDKLVLLQQDGYYGFPNRQRGRTDPRQCVWRGLYDTESDEDYTAPLASHPSSIDGLVEFQSNHFGGQLRGNLIIAKYKKDLYRAILSPDGQSLIPQSRSLLPLGIGQHSLDVTQAPDGTLVVAQHLTNGLAYYAPREESANTTTILSVFPRRGGGGHEWHMYGHNLLVLGTSIAVVLRDANNVVSSCPITSQANTKLSCQLTKRTVTQPTPMTVELVAQANESSGQPRQVLATLEHAYRYIPGRY
jgi:glucose/arabinose dehydrogenase